MKDVEGNVLVVGDTVLTTKRGDRGVNSRAVLYKAVITSFTPKRARIRYEVGGHTLKSGNMMVRITSQTQEIKRLLGWVSHSSPCADLLYTLEKIRKIVDED